MYPTFFARLVAARTHPAVVGLATFATTIALILGQHGSSIA